MKKTDKDKLEDKSQETILENIKQEIDRRSINKVIYLPAYPDSKRAVPNSFIRSALFAAIQGKDRQFVKGLTLASQDGITIKFTGEELNQSDLDVWEALIHLAREQHLGDSCHFSGYEILKTLGLPTSQAHYKYLHSTITRLTACAVEIIDSKFKYTGSLVNWTKLEIAKKYYEVSFNKHMAKLFSENMWTAIDWEQRRLIREKPLTQALHSYYSSHRNPFPIKLETLQAFTGNKNKDIHGFKRQVSTALKTLEEIGFLSHQEIKEGMVHVTRNLPAIEQK